MEPDLSALRAEARRLLKERHSSEVHCHISTDREHCACERCKRGIPVGSNDWWVIVVHVGGDGDATRV